MKASFAHSLGRTQRGSSMLFALLAMTALMLGAMALLRSVDSGSLALGNLGFKKDATLVAQQGTDAAIAYLSANVLSAKLNADDVKNGYYASSLQSLKWNPEKAKADSALVDWGITNCTGLATAQCVQPTSPTTDKYGNTVSWIITRLCATSGATDSPNSCLKPAVQTQGTVYDMGSRDYHDPEKFSTSSSGPLYRVITRVVGVRGAVSYTETLVHF